MQCEIHCLKFIIIIIVIKTGVNRQERMKNQMMKNAYFLFFMSS